MKRSTARSIALGIAVFALILLCGGLLSVLVAGDDDAPDSAGVQLGATASAAAKAVKPSRSVRPAPTVKPPATIEGDDIVHVGEDVKAGTYRAVGKVDSGMCYWKKSVDAEGSDIIDNEIVDAGRPQVTLKAGQWFTSSGCPTWVKR